MIIQAVVPLMGDRQPVVPVRWSPETRFLPKTWFLRPLAGEVDGFCGVQSNNYWTSTTNADNTTNAWNVNLNNGNVNNDNKTNTNYVWPVRGGE